MLIDLINKRTKRSNNKSIKVLKERIICTSRGHSGDPNKAIDRKLGESTSRSGGIYILQKAEKELGRKIPIIFSSVGYDKNTKKYFVKMEKGYLPENADRKKLALEYIKKLDLL